MCVWLQKNSYIKKAKINDMSTSQANIIFFIKAHDKFIEPSKKTSVSTNKHFIELLEDLCIN